ncbi:MAG: ERCC4 domain-containing protein [Ruminococcus sp.]|nr:ERCC4 domain-containing protein [Ruminococcus sp.]
MAATKKDFMKKVCIIIDTREQKNKHITSALDSMGIAYESRKLDFGDYSFTAEGRDFSMSCVVERKANVDEIYSNIMQERGRIEKELYAAANLSNQCTIFIENVAGWEELKAYEVPGWQMEKLPQRKVRDIGRHVYSALRSWKSSNRYRFDVQFIPDNAKTAERLLENFYYYWHNYKEQTAARK